MSVEMFDKIMGNCAGIDIMLITEEDVRFHCEMSGTTTEEQELAVTGLLEYQNEPKREGFVCSNCGSDCAGECDSTNWDKEYY